MYVKCGELKNAYRVFDEMPKRNVVPWNMIICGMVGCGGQLWRWRSGDGAVLLFKGMLVSMVRPDYITFVGLLGACMELNDIEVVRQLHCFVVQLNFSLNHKVGSSLVDLYGKCGFMEDARRLFDEFVLVDLVLWNVMISCYSLNGYFEDGFEVFRLMRSDGEKGDGFTFSKLLSSCGMLGSCKLGEQIHGLVIRLGVVSDVLVASALVDMYAKNRCLDDARRAFDGMITRNAVSWTTIIVGCGKNGNGKEAVKLLKQMVEEGFKPDELTLASILSSCAEMAAITEIIQVHALAVKNGLEVHLSVGNALINAYSKCGNIGSACASFGSIVKPNIVSWTSVIGAYAFHGLPKQAVETFETMLSKGVKPDRIAFVEVLSACSHGGLVNEGSHYFTTMSRDHQIVPDSEHYACVVDLLGRSGHLEEAYQILVNAPFDPSPNVLGSFIWACRARDNIAQAKWAAEKLFTLEPNKPVNYKLMSNIYASAGCWTDVARVRKMMRDNCSNKVPGCSWIENGGSVHTFLSGDKSHQQTKTIYTISIKEDQDFSHLFAGFVGFLEQRWGLMNAIMLRGMDARQLDCRSSAAANIA
ncbi:hypothetical protein Scep_006206 [Stephania cephalantha]|uniref:Pentatricopeptide repeat-containing protein n=1 Tax=Stephania cephalantha TaxID=152367 RepID=A0AAP0K942_9MAGN